MRTVGCGVMLVLLAGCHGGDDAYIEPTVPVSGVVTFQGKPLAGFQVLFMPMGQRPATGITDSDGRFVLGTNELNDGAVTGTHQVAIVWRPEVPGEAGKEDLMKPLPAPPVKLPEKYGDPAKSGITIEVPEDGKEDVEILLE